MAQQPIKLEINIINNYNGLRLTNNCPTLPVYKLKPYHNIVNSPMENIIAP